MKESRWDIFWDKAGDILQIPLGTILVYNAILIAIETGGCPPTNLNGLFWTYGNFFLGVRLLMKGFTLTSKQTKLANKRNERRVIIPAIENIKEEVK